MSGEIHSPTLPLSLDELLTTTRAVRKRLDLARPVEREVIEDCLRIAQQAPGGGVRQSYSFIVVTDPAKRQALAGLYRQAVDDYFKEMPATPKPLAGEDARAALMKRYLDSANHLRDHLHEVPVHVIPCFSPRADNLDAFGQATRWGCVLPAAWSFMLAARARGLGTAWTTVHLRYEKEAAQILGIPYAQVEQAALIPVAYTTGTTFKPGFREPLDRIAHWDTW